MAAPGGPAVSDLPAIPQALAASVRTWTRRRRLVAAGRVAAFATGAACLLTGGAMTLDLVGDPLPWGRAALAASAHLVAVGGLAAAMLRWRSFSSRRAEAVALEAAAGLAGEPLSGALALAEAPQAGTSRWMAERTLALAAVAANGLDLRRLAPWRPLAPALLAAAAGVLALLAAAASDPAARAAAARALLPWRELPAPGDELLVAEPGDVWLAPGASLSISARAASSRLAAELVWADGRGEARELAVDGGVHRLQLGPLQTALRWRLRGDGLASAWREVRLVEVPRVVSVALQVSPPGYTGLPDERIQGGDAQVIAGSNVGVEVVLDAQQAVTAVLVADGSETPMPLTRSPYGGHFGAARLRIAADTAWHLRLIVPGGSGGVVVEPPQRWRIACQQDAPPEVSAASDAEVVAPGRAIRITARGADDIALAAMWLEASDAGMPLRIALPVPSGARQAEASATIVPADLGAGPGDRVALVPVVRDRAGAERRGEPVRVLVAQPAHAARHDLAQRLAGLSEAAAAAVTAAADAERAWRASARAWRPEDPAAGAPGLRSAAERARALSAAATRVGDAAESAAVLPGAPGNLDQMSTRAVTLAGGALALASRSAAAEAGTADAVAGAVDAAGQLVQAAETLAASAALAAAATAAEAAAADAESARDSLAGAAAVLGAEWAWIRPAWRPGLRARFWRGREPDAGAPAHAAAEVPAVADRDVPGLGRELWCVRWDGEIQLPQAGRWVFRCTADDGVRLRVAGRDLLPAEAWRDQAATPYEGAIELPAGWHPVSLDFFQGGGPCQLRFEAGVAALAAVPIERLRHLGPPAGSTLQAMTALSAGAAGAAVERGRGAGRALLAAVDAARAANAGVQRLPGGAAAAAKQAAAAVEPLRQGVDWSDVAAVATAASAADAIAAALQDQARSLREACRQEGRGQNRGGMADRLRDAAAKPGQGEARRLAGDLTGERARLVGLVGDAMADPAYRAAALAAVWAIDDVAASLLGSDAAVARAAAAAALPPLALVARHTRAAEAAAASAAKGAAGAGSLLNELAVSPGWPPRLLRSGRDRLRTAAAALRAGGATAEAAAIAGEAAWAAELEALRPSAPGAADLAGAAVVLRDLALLPQPDGLAEVADFFERIEPAESDVVLASDALAGAHAARRAAATAALGESAAGLAGAGAALRSAGLGDIASRAEELAGQARTVAAAPDAERARGLADVLSGSVAAPLAQALADGRIAAGSPAAQAGRLAAQAAAEARELAAVAALPSGGAPEQAQRDAWSRASDASAQGAAAAAIDFPEEHRAAIRAYLRRVGGGR